jgi:WhiB family redox-sensing transcriptional regulator
VRSVTGADHWSEGTNVFNLERPWWMDRAACKAEGTDVFFHERYRHAVRVAKSICASCTVRMHCLRFALANDEVGIWGGLTTSERRAYARKHGAPKPTKRLGG